MKYSTGVYSFNNEVAGKYIYSFQVEDSAADLPFIETVEWAGDHMGATIVISQDRSYFKIYYFYPVSVDYFDSTHLLQPSDLGGTAISDFYGL